MKIGSFPHSLARRLAVLFAVSAALLLTGLAGGTYWALEREFQVDENRLLDDTVTLLQTILAENDNLVETLHQELPRDLEAFHFHRYQLRILDTGGARLYESIHFPELPESFLSKLVCYREGQDGSGRAFRTGTTSYRVLLAEAHSQRRKLKLLVALDTSQKTRTLTTYSRVLVVMVVFGVTVAALGAGTVVARGLWPLEVMTRLVSRLRVDRLSQRLSRASWPTELQPLAHEFDRLLDEIEDGLERISGFCLDMAHELRNPLTSLRLEAEIALSQPREGEEYRQVLSSALEELERISVLIERLLLVARTDSARPHLEPEVFSVKERVEALAEFHFATVEEGVQIDIPDQAVLMADAPLFELALGNLFSNALKYGKPPYRVSWSKSPNHAILEVSNAGPAIPPEHLPLIFERLYRVDPSRSQSSPGYGLGLALVRSAMRAHGGEVEVSSDSQQTCFRLIFPLAAVETDLSKM